MHCYLFANLQASHLVTQIVYVLQQTAFNFAEGAVLLINKPLQWTSFDVIRKLRSLIKIKKIGHAGTLDPLASGLLIVCTGKFTKRINEYMAQQKEYTGIITLGATTPTYDLESAPENFKPTDAITATNIKATTALFTGTIQQVPPAHSAIKKDGKRVYELARKGIEVQLDARTITINEFEITHIAMPHVSFRVVCSTGTYIRSLANDFGAALGCGAHLSKLCRTRIGNFSVADAYSMADFETMIKNPSPQL
ncbi:MAG: tRNA pseudouridine(55) synthase TruB [Bacteroidota bacterium]